MTAAYSHLDRVRFGDLDAMRHLNNVSLLRFFESARIGYVADLLQDRPEQRDAFGLVVAECHVSYRSPAYYDEELRTSIWPSHVVRSSFRLNFDMHATVDDRLVADGYGVLVGFDHGAKRAAPLPEGLKAALAAAVA